MTSTASQKQGVLQRIFRRLLHSYFLMARGLTLGVRAIVRSPDGKFLLVGHTYRPGWHFPGGGVEKGHTFEASLAFELKQETGLTSVGQARLHGAFHNHEVSKRDHIAVYLCDVRGQLMETPKSLEIAKAQFFGPDELPDDIDEGSKRRIEEVLGYREPEATW